VARPKINSNRVAVVSAVRTPFVRSFGVFENETALQLSLRAATEAASRSGLALSQLDECIWGTVIPQTKNPNLARDLILFSGMPKHIPGFTLNMACASSLQSILLGTDAIKLGRCKAVLAGGVEVLSDVPITYSDEARKFLTKLSRSKTFGEKLSLLKNLNPKAFLPVPPALAEPFTGLSMGEHGEIMAVKNNVSRERQDEFAVQSHLKASAALQAGHLQSEIVPVWTSGKNTICVSADNIVRADTSIESLAKLKPVFDKKHGTLTAGNSSSLTDGAAGVVLTSEALAISEKLNVLGYVVDAVSVAVDPKDQLLIGPAYAIPKLLERNQLKPEDVGVYEIHEAFAAQVLSCLDSLENSQFCSEKLGLKKPFGNIPAEKLNIDGGSLAYGHPFAATGARIVGRALRIAQRRGEKYAVIGICAAGGMAQSMLLETGIEK
jgi:acetyl-CoA acetyltransferase family protein